jgi:hypothetical protein
MSILPECYDKVKITCREYIENHPNEQITEHRLIGKHYQYCMYECLVCEAQRLAMPSEGFEVP